MKLLTLRVLLFGFILPASAESQAISISHSGSELSTQGAAENFTGSVRIDPLFPAVDPSRVSGGQVTFEPGARTAWHTHPLGQVLIVTAGSCWVQEWHGPVQRIREGDVVRIPPGQKHWHGATATTPMTHIALQEQLNGKAVEWMEKVREKEYNMAHSTREATSATTAQQKITEDLRKVSPALAKFSEDRLYGEVWKRPGLSPRDRSIVTVSAQIARNQNSGSLTRSIKRSEMG